MKKLVILFSALLIAFMGTWVFKSKSPSSRPEEQLETSGLLWWEVSAETLAADTDWILDPEIPENYIPVPGEEEVYMVIDENGNITEYRQRKQQEDGSWLWETINPDIPDNYEAVEGLENVYKVTDSDGKVSYYRYIRNEDDTFAFVEVDETGKLINDETPSGDEIPANYKRYSGNVYAVYNENGVVIGYKERRLDEDGNYYWVDSEKPKDNSNSPGGSQNSTLHIGGGTGNATGNGSGGSFPGGSSGSGNVIYNSNGTYSQTETIISTETSGGRVITYQTIVTKVFDSNGTLLSTKKDGPIEISNVPASNSSVGANTPDKSKRASTLSAELARVSVSVSFNTSLANEVLADINAERASAGLSALSMSSSSNAYKLAATRAADMAIYNHSDYDSPMYGSLSEMCSFYGVSTSKPSEVLWKTTADKTAAAIATRLKVMSNGVLTSGNYSSIGISIVSRNGYFYIDVVLI